MNKHLNNLLQKEELDAISKLRGHNYVKKLHINQEDIEIVTIQDYTQE